MDRLDNHYNTFKHNEKYFRPSKLPAINTRYFSYNFFDSYSNEDYNKILLPAYLFISPEDTIINFFSILREAENIPIRSCGSIGFAKSPYPISYNFFTQQFKTTISYMKYLNFFKNIGHINLIKLHKIPNKIFQDTILKYFVELEIIENTIDNKISFSYYYEFIYIKKEDDKYKISNIELNREDFLCAAYHGWAHNAELYVDLTYGDWCNLIKQIHPTEQIGYIKNIYITSTDGHEYKLVFFELTNGTDIAVGQFILNSNNQWEHTKIDVHNCLKK